MGTGNQSIDSGDYNGQYFNGYCPKSVPYLILSINLTVSHDEFTVVVIGIDNGQASSYCLVVDFNPIACAQFFILIAFETGDYVPPNRFFNFLVAHILKLLLF